MRRWSRQLVIGACTALVWAGVAGGAQDPTMSSNGYQVVESEIGGSGCNPTTGNFCGTSSSYSMNPSVDDGGGTLGEFAVGDSASNSYSLGAGFDTTAQPGLTFSVNTSSVNLGILSTSTAKFATATFNVKNYTSYGYVVQIVGSAPSYSGHSLSPLTTDTASSAGTEQFGVNTVANPIAGFGANPTQTPSGAFSYGVAGDGSTGTYGTNRPYTVAEKWRYNSGEVVASAPKTSGETDYTMTFLANQGNTTPSGAYTGNLTLVATGTY